MCQPITLATNQSEASALAVDATNIYWGTSSGMDTVMKMPLGGGSPTTLVSGLQDVQGIVVNANYVYFTTHASSMGTGTVGFCSIGGCGNQPVYLSKTEANPTGIAVDAQSAYWTSSVVAPNGAVRYCALQGCSGSPSTLASGYGEPDTIAVDSNDAYWTNYADGTVVKTPLPGMTGSGTVTVLATGQNNAVGITLAASNVYFTDSRVNRVAIAGGAVTQVVAPDNAGAITTDGTYLYWTTQTTVNKCAIAGCAGGSTTIAANQSFPGGIAVDSVAVYWVTFNGGTVMKVAK